MLRLENRAHCRTTPALFTCCQIHYTSGTVPPAAELSLYLPRNRDCSSGNPFASLPTTFPAQQSHTS